MACTKPSGLPSLVLLFLVLAVAAAGPGVALKLEPTGTIEHFPPLLDCAPTTASPSRNDSAFHANVLSLLAALPSAAAATGFASLPSASAGAGRGPARALGLCFGPAAPAEFGCGECLQAAVAAVGRCADDVLSAGAWRPGCSLVYAEDSASLADKDENSQSQPRFPADETRSYPDSLEQRLADLAKALAEPKRRPLWKMALSVLFYVLAAIGAVTVVFLLCAFVAGCYLAESLFRNVEAAGARHGNAAAGGEQGEGIAVYVAATNGPSPVWSVAMQLRFH